MSVKATLIEWFMDRYRGQTGLFGRIVLRADVRWMKSLSLAILAKDEDAQPTLKAQRSAPGEPEYHH